MSAGLQMPRATDRRAWDGLAGSIRQEVLEWGATCRETPYPALTATQYMAYVRGGSREVFQRPYFDRRMQLIAVTLAECVQGGGAYLDAVTDGLWCICEESTWCVPAHNTSGLSLAEVDSPTVDLFAAQTAALLSWVCYLLEGSLPEQVARRVLREVEGRVLGPFVARDDFWWMGITRTDLNNWTPWILSNVLASANIWRWDIAARAEEILARWLACIPDDGGLDEGVAYWNMAGGSLLDCLEHLGADRYGEEKIRNLAAFPLRAHIDGEYFLNFADCDAKPHLDGERVYTFGRRTDNEALMALGASLCARQASVFPQDTPEFYRVLCRLFTPVPTTGKVTPVQSCLLEDLQLWIRRKGPLYAAIKGGHNAESHNHNDVGSLIVYVDGEPAIVDAGNMVYTAATFNDAKRYGLWNTRSRNHNVPLIGDCEQRAGHAYRARDVVLAVDSASMDIAPAYPKEAGVIRLHRTLAMGGDALVLTDDIALTEPLPVTWVFLLRHRPQMGPGTVQSGSILLRHAQGFAVSCDEYPVTDARMARSYPGTLYRLTLTAEAAARHRQAFTIERCEA